MTVPSLTQTEAAARAALISVQEYQVVVDLSGLVEGSEVRCSSTIRFGSHDDGRADVRRLCCAGGVGSP